MSAATSILGGLPGLPVWALVGLILLVPTRRDVPPASWWLLEGLVWLVLAIRVPGTYLERVARFFATRRR
jgi:hypothetical protein